MRLFRNALISAALLAAVAVPLAKAVVPNVPSTSQYAEASQIIGTLNYVISTINAAINPQTMAPFAAPRNYLDNGQMDIQQRGTGTRTCGTTTIPSSAYAADRWGCNVNVTSGAGTLQVITSNLPAGPVFDAGMVFYRTSGALAQPQCVMQEIPTNRVNNVQGQNMVLSFYAQGLANMLAEQTTLNAYIFTGTGTDEGLQSFTASPAITPAFTSIASTLTQAFTITSSWARYSYSFNMPTTATEAAVALCWTPTTGGTAGTTDGFRFTGVQLEQSVTGLPSAFENRFYDDELRTAQRYFYRISEGTITAGAVMVGGGLAQGTTTTCSTLIPFPVTMRVAPTYANALTASTFKIVSSSQAATALGTPFSATLGANTPYNASINFTTTGMTAKDACMLVSAAGSGVMDFTADF